MGQWDLGTRGSWKACEVTSGFFFYFTRVVRGARAKNEKWGDEGSRAIEQWMGQLMEYERE